MFFNIFRSALPTSSNFGLFCVRPFNCKRFATPAEATRCSEVLWWSCVGLLSCTFAFAIFLSLSWVLSGTPSNSLGVFGTFLGSLLGLSRGSWGLSWAFLALLGLSWAALLAYLVLFWTLLGCSWASLFEPLGPKGGQAATRCPKTAPKVAQETPKGAKTVPKTCKFRVLF